MWDFIFDAGFDALTPGQAGERSRARRSEKTLDEFERTGTATFPGARRAGGKVEDGYLTVKDRSITFSQVSGSEMTHVDVALDGLVSFWAMANEGRVERSVNKYWTLFRLNYGSAAGSAPGPGEVVLASSPNGHASVLKVLAAARIPQIQPDGWVSSPAKTGLTRGMRRP